MSIKDKIENAREDDWLTKDLSEEELNKIKEEVKREKAIERMKLVIDIPEEVYKSIQDNDYCGISNADMYNAVKNGTPLPKGHGRLIDSDELLKAMDTWDKFGVDDTNSLFRLDNLSLPHYVPYIHYDDMVKSVSGAETIIEADKEIEGEE